MNGLGFMDIINMARTSRPMNLIDESIDSKNNDTSNQVECEIILRHT